MYKYTGNQERTYPQYRDAAKGTTLVAEPGNVYDINTPYGAPLPPEWFEEVAENEVVAAYEDNQHELDRMTDESGVDHTESE